MVLQDLLELTHFLTRVRLVPEVAEDPGVPETERVRGQALAEKLGVAVLARNWQMLLKGLGEARTAPSPIQAAEMVLIRLAHASELPTPGELVRSLRGEPGTALDQGAPAGAGGGAGGTASGPRAVAPSRAGGSPGGPSAIAGSAALAPEPRAQTQPEPETKELVALESFVEVVALARARKEGILANHLEGDLHLVRFEPGVIEFRPGERAPSDLAGRLGRCLQDWTGRRWLVGVSSASGAPSLREQRQARDAERLEEAARDPLVQEVMTLFPGARIVEVREDAADKGGERGVPEPSTAQEPQEDEK